MKIKDNLSRLGGAQTRRILKRTVTMNLNRQEIEEFIESELRLDSCDEVTFTWNPFGELGIEIVTSEELREVNPPL
jgi:hypothetical protein